MSLLSIAQKSFAQSFAPPPCPWLLSHESSLVCWIFGVSYFVFYICVLYFVLRILCFVFSALYFLLCISCFVFPALYFLLHISYFIFCVWYSIACGGDFCIVWMMYLWFVCNSSACGCARAAQLAANELEQPGIRPFAAGKL